MSDSTRKYFIELPQNQKISAFNEQEFDESEKEKFFKLLKNKKYKPVRINISDNGIGTPAYVVRNKLIFSDNNGKVLCFDKRTGREFKNHKYNIIKDKNGNDKYVTKKDDNNYFRYSLNDGHLIDSIHKLFRTGFSYRVYDQNNKKFKEIELGSINNIDEAIDLVKQKKIEPIGLKPEYQYEKDIAETLGIYPTGDYQTLNFFFKEFYNEIIEFCVDKEVLKKEEVENKGTFHNVESLIKKLEPLAEKEGCSKEKYVLRYIANKYKEDIDRFHRIGERKLFANKIFDQNHSLKIRNSEDEEIEMQQAYAFNEQNELKVQKNSIKIGDKTAGKNSNDEKYGYRYYFVKPVGQPMYLFKKERGEFSNHSNFPPSVENPERLIEAAGSLTIKNGKITNISNSSGHFQPNTDTIYIALEYIASLCSDCDIRNVIDPQFKLLNGGCKIVSNVNKTFEIPEVKNKPNQWSKYIEPVAEVLPKHEIIKINSKAARKAAKEKISRA